MILKNIQQVKIGHAVNAISYLIGIIAFVGIYEHIHGAYSAFFISMFLASIYFEYKKNYYIPTRKGFAKKIPIRQFTVLRVLTAFVNLSGMRMEDTEKVQNEEIVYPGSMYQ